jgi:hypothetical protein
MNFQFIHHQIVLDFGVGNSYGFDLILLILRIEA